jgi:hypothetical protein
MSEQQKQPNGRPEDCATAWMAVLERARRVGDFERAAQATRELRRLGIVVRFTRPESAGVAHAG